jgi:hypothetical protein
LVDQVAFLVLNAAPLTNFTSSIWAQSLLLSRGLNDLQRLRRLGPGEIQELSHDRGDQVALDNADGNHVVMAVAT